MNCIVLDIETTGLSRYTDKITEIAAIKLEHSKIKNEFHTLINPERHIPSFITRLTGINDEMVKDAPVVEEVLPKLKKFFREDHLVAHSAGFDLGFLSHNFRENSNLDLDNKHVCTLKLANRLPIQVENKKLGTLCKFFNIDNEQEHRARGDALATVELLNKFKPILNHNNINTIEDVHQFLMKPACVCRQKIILPK